MTRIVTRDWRLIALSEADYAIFRQCIQLGLDGGRVRGTLEGGQRAADLIVTVGQTYFTDEQAGTIKVEPGSEKNEFVFTKTSYIKSK